MLSDGEISANKGVDGMQEDQLVEEMDGDNNPTSQTLTYFAGLVDTVNLLRLKRMVHKFTKGMC